MKKRKGKGRLVGWLGPDHLSHSSAGNYIRGWGSNMWLSTDCSRTLTISGQHISTYFQTKHFTLKGKLVFKVKSHFHFLPLLKFSFPPQRLFNGTISAREWWIHRSKGKIFHFDSYCISPDRFRCIWMRGVRIQSGLSRSTLHRQTFLLSS